MKLKFAHSAQAKFLDALAYLLRKNPKASRDFRKRAGEVLARLKKFPNSERELPEFPPMMYREVMVPPYRFFYRVADETTVLIVAVWHSSQEPEPPEDDLEG